MRALGQLIGSESTSMPSRLDPEEFDAQLKLFRQRCQGLAADILVLDASPGTGNTEHRKVFEQWRGATKSTELLRVSSNAARGTFARGAGPQVSRVVRAKLSDKQLLAPPVGVLADGGLDLVLRPVEQGDRFAVALKTHPDVREIRVLANDRIVTRVTVGKGAIARGSFQLPEELREQPMVRLSILAEGQPDWTTGLELVALNQIAA
jgi:hypothetical protein